MDYKHNKEIVPLAKTLRKNMTKEEKHLQYDYLKEYPIRFIRQKIIGKYIVDFYCAKAKLVIELDGSRHYDDKGIEKRCFENCVFRAIWIKSYKNIKS